MFRLRKYVRKANVRRQYLKNIAEIKRLLKNDSSIENLVKIVQANKQFFAYQVVEEISELLRLVNEAQPYIVCEIGSRRGGTLIMFSRVIPKSGKIFAIDIGYSDLQTNYLPRFAGRKQEIEIYKGDSKSVETLMRLEKWLNGRKIDFLFIDGDHSYEGVKADYENFSPFVRDGGLIAFHDINPDNFTKYGEKTEAYTGDVPKFWNEIRVGKDTREIVKNPNQDGYGIGIIYV